MSKNAFTRVDFLLNEIEDEYVRENFYRLKLFLENLDLGDDIINIVNNIISSGSSDAVNATRLKITRIAQEAILAQDVVKAFSATHVELATADATREDATIIGIADNDANIGESVNVVLLGVVTNAAFTIFNVNDPLFLDVDGGITNIKRSSGFHTIVGKSVGGTDILFQPSNPITIA